MRSLSGFRSLRLEHHPGPLFTAVLLVRLYKVLWQGFSEEEATWEPKSRLPPQLIAQFELEPSAGKRVASEATGMSPPSKK